MSAEALEISLQLTIADKAIQIPGGNVKRCELTLEPYGFHGEVDFWVSVDAAADAVLDSFVKADLMELRVQIQGVHNLPSPKPAPLVVSGLVTEKALLEMPFVGVAQKPILLRRYTLAFADAAAVLWREHYPMQLYADASMSDAITKEVVEGIKLELSWGALDAMRPLVCVGLGAGQGQASFYDYLMWYAEANGGVFYYDYDKATYHFAGAKPGGAKAGTLLGREVERFELRLPSPRRHARKILNADATAPKNVDIAQAQAVAGIHQDVLIRTPVASELDDRQKLETARLKNRAPELELAFRQWPTVPFWPGAQLACKAGAIDGKLWFIGKSFRSYAVHLAARALQPEADNDRDQPFTVYDLELRVRLESPDDAVAHLPAFTPPTYPVLAEGLIVSDAGQPDDRTYSIYQQAGTSQDCYKVNVPLWNQKILVPYQPLFTDGEQYFPAYKGQRVLVALYPERAEIVRFLDWADEARLPADGQGNQLLFGKNPTSKTSLKYVYVDEKPVLSLTRINDQDTELLQLEEGNLVLQTKEDSSLKTASQTVDLTAKVEAARDKLATQGKAATSKLDASFKQTSEQLNQKIDETTAKTGAALDAMEQMISGKVEAANAQIEAAMAGLSQKTAAFAAKAKAASAQLRANSKL